jgi:hypothetical protein
VGIVQENAGTTGTGTPASVDATLPAPTTAGAGRFVVIIVTCDNVVDTPAGFSIDRSQVNNAGHYHFRKAAADAEDTWTITPAAGAATCWYVAEVEDLDSTPLDQVNSTGTGSSGTTQATGDITTTVDDELIFVSYSCSVSNETLVQVTAYDPATFVENADVFTEKASGTDVGLAVATRTVAATGTYGCTATWDVPVARTAIIVSYKLAPAGGGTHEIGRVTEVETARALARSKVAALGRVTEVETARGLTRSKSVAVGRVTEIETARALSLSSTIEIGRVTEVESARGLTRSKSVAVGRVTEVESARTLSAAGSAPPGDRERASVSVRRSQGAARPRRITA